MKYNSKSVKISQAWSKTFEEWAKNFCTWNPEGKWLFPQYVLIDSSGLNEQHTVRAHPKHSNFEP